MVVRTADSKPAPLWTPLNFQRWTDGSRSLERSVTFAIGTNALSHKIDVYGTPVRRASGPARARVAKQRVRREDGILGGFMIFGVRMVRFCKMKKLSARVLDSGSRFSVLY